MTHRLRVLTGMCATALVPVALSVALLPVSADAAAQPSLGPPAWAVMTSQNPGSNVDALSSVSCASTTFCIAVGPGTNLASQLEETAAPTVIEEFNGQSWSLMPSPSPSSGLNSLNAVSCTSATFCMAIGYSQSDSNYLPLTERFDGTTWTVIPSGGLEDQAHGLSNPSVALNGVSCTSASFCAVVGTAKSSTSQLAMITGTYNGTTWSATPLSARGVTGVSIGGVLNAVSCSSRSSCVAVGYTPSGSLSNSQVKVLNSSTGARYNGATWALDTRVPNQIINNVDDNLLTGVSCASRSSCVTVGEARYAKSITAYASSTSGSSWTTPMDLPTGTANRIAFDVSCVKSACVITGINQPAVGRGHVNAFAGRLARGQWTRSPTPSTPQGGLQGVSCVTTTFCMAVGFTILTTSSTQTLVESYLPRPVTHSRTTKPAPNH